nr:Rpn family recombination-promoting nuclease/putative transposase [Halorhodospira halochloris]
MSPSAYDDPHPHALQEVIKRRNGAARQHRTQSTVDHSLPIRLLHYVACFYDHLIKTKMTTARQGMPPIFPVVIYNSSRRWAAQEDIYRMIRPQAGQQYFGG